MHRVTDGDSVGRWDTCDRGTGEPSGAGGTCVERGTGEPGEGQVGHMWREAQVSHGEVGHVRQRHR